MPRRPQPTPIPVAVPHGCRYPVVPHEPHPSPLADRHWVAGQGLGAVVLRGVGRALEVHDTRVGSDVIELRDEGGLGVGLEGVLAAEEKEPVAVEGVSCRIEKGRFSLCDPMLLKVGHWVGSVHESVVTEAFIFSRCRA